jgi:putative mRNA 3-end processing factor
MVMIEFTPKGLFCPRAQVYIDPWKPVEKAIITHAHSDHAYAGHLSYLCTKETVPLLKHRLGSHIKTQGLEYNTTITLNGVRISFHPAGHIYGSAQIRLEYRGEIWVISGDYKTENDTISRPIEVQKCHTFITESTFGLPAFQWKPQHQVFTEINDWWRNNKQKGVVSVISAYSLGKAQRIIKHLDSRIGPIFTHGAIENTHDVLRREGLDIPHGLPVTDGGKPEQFQNGIVIAPPAAMGSAWTKRFGLYEEAVASGWMAVRGIKRRRNVSQGFILSDHADWQGLNQVIRETGASRILVTHGFSDIFSRWLQEQGLESRVIETEFSGDEAPEQA